MKVYYWSPFISHVATVTAVINSIISLKKFSTDNVDYRVINVFKEWFPYEDELKKNKIESVDLGTFLNINFLPKLGFISSRFTYILTFLFSIIKLHKFLKKEKPEFFIIHLISSIPLSLLLFFNYNTRFILRISGYPKMTLFRKMLWKLCDRKLYKVFCPTNFTKNYMIKSDIFSKSKIFLVRDPIINVKETNKSKKLDIVSNFNWLKDKKYIISIGRLTRQKNFTFLINEFSKIVIKHPDLNLIILGDGDEKENLNKLIIKKKLNTKIFLLGNQKNIYPFLLNSLFFIITSDWEDPGFVILEAMFSKKIVLSSNCESGPIDIIKDNLNGFLFKSNDSKDFQVKFFSILDLLKNEDFKSNKILNSALKTSKFYTLFNHYKDISPHFNKI
jgi:glycosyltransferase involved in cell wall biosynthesis